jgi:hypothetical protein
MPPLLVIIYPLMTATFTFGRELRNPNELPVPQNETIQKLLAWTAIGPEDGGLFIPLADQDDPLGVVPQGSAHFSKDGKQIQSGDRPPLYALDNGFKAFLHAGIRDASYHPGIGLPYNAGVDLERENGIIVGYSVFASDALKNVLLSEKGIPLRPQVVRISSAGFESKLGAGKGSSYYASADTKIEVLDVYDVDLTVLGEGFWPLVEDPIASAKIRKYYKELKVSTETGTTIGVRLQDIAEYERLHPELSKQ